MASKKDMRREDLIVPFHDPDTDKKTDDMASTMGSTLPMAAMFMRNKVIGWVAVVVAVQNWLSETPAQKAKAATPGYFSVGMAFLGLGVAYLPLFMPPQPVRGLAGSGTEAPAAIPQS